MLKSRIRFARPFASPVAAFAAAILIGGGLLCMPFTANGNVRPVDSFFIATSSVCVTGLAPCDVFAVYNIAGQTVILLLVQLGGLGIITFTTLLAWLVYNRISLADRLAVEQSIFYNPEFSLPVFLKRVFCQVFFMEALGAILIFVLYGDRVNFFNAVFLSVSAFCNAGFAPWPDNLESFRHAYAFNCIIMALITAGGLGFFVVDEILKAIYSKWIALKAKFTGIAGQRAPCRLSWYSHLVLQTTIWLVLAGFFVCFFLGCLNPAFSEFSLADRIFAALFESITSRTAGFASVNQASFSSATLFFIIFLMFIGGSPCSCAGGIKTTTFRVLIALFKAKLIGRSQAVANGRAFDNATVANALLLFSSAICIIFVASFILVVLEQGALPHRDVPPFFDIFFEAVSAFCTVGLSINLTPALCDASKIVLCLLMFIGRLGPIWLITTMQKLQSPVAIRYPEDNVPTG